MSDVTIWDGEEFHHVPRKEAEALVKADKAQILSDGLVDGLSMKYRHEFTGYKTRELRPKPAAAAPAAVEADESKPKKTGRKKKASKKRKD